jgi:hypothetical protein
MTKEIDYVELLKLAHEKLGSQSDMIAELEKELSRIVSGLFSENELAMRDLEQQVMGRLDGVSYALNMYCTTMSPKEFPPIGEYYAGQLQAKALKEQGK